MDLDNGGSIVGLPASSAGSAETNTWTPPMGAAHPAAPHAPGGPVAGSPSPHPLCAGCQLRIVDPFYLCARERSLASNNVVPQQKWHSQCLKCVECGVSLEDQASCFEKNGNIFCKEHRYYRCVFLYLHYLIDTVDSAYTVKSRCKESRFSVKTRFKEWKGADGGHSLNRDFTVFWTLKANSTVLTFYR